MRLDDDESVNRTNRGWRDDGGPGGKKKKNNPGTRGRREVKSLHLKNKETGFLSVLHKHDQQGRLIWTQSFQTVFSFLSPKRYHWGTKTRYSKNSEVRGSGKSPNTVFEAGNMKTLNPTDSDQPLRRLKDSVKRGPWLHMRHLAREQDCVTITFTFIDRVHWL